VLLLTPGYLVLRAAFGSAGRHLDPLARAGATVMLSLALEPILAIASDAAGVRLTLRAVSGANLLLGLLAVLVARLRDQADESPTPVPSARARRARAWRRISIAGYVFGVLSVAAFAIFVGTRIPAPPYAGYSEVFLGESLRGGDTVQVSPGQTFALPVLAANSQTVGETYRVRAFLDDRTEPGELLAVVSPASTWRGTLTVQVPTDRCVHRVTAVFTPLGTTRALGSVRTLTVYIQAAPIGTDCHAR